MSPTTVVTCLFDLASREAPGTRHDVAQYLEWGEFVLALDADLVCFTEPSIEPTIRSRREHHGLLERTEMVECTLESLSSYGLLERATEARLQNPLLNGDPVKDTPLHTVLTWGKLELLTRAIERNPFATDHFAWVDFGIAKVAKTDHHRQDEVFAETPDAVRLLQMRPLDLTSLEDTAHHLSYRRGHFAAGLISGHADRLREFCQAAGDELERALAASFAPLDEQLLELVVARRPELFSFHHGDYDHITENYSRPRGSADNLLFQLREWRAREDWAEAAELADRVVHAAQGGSFESAPATLAQLLEECFLASYYAHQPDQTDARAAAMLYLERTRADPDFRDEFLRNEIRVRTNFSFLREPVAQPVVRSLRGTT
jgi:hypothetical protein